jgi:UDP-N-acetyl-D-mannosaminuronate dehydrogenase
MLLADSTPYFTQAISSIPDMTSSPLVTREPSSDTMELPLGPSSKSTMIAVIGVGYVGEHLVRVFSSAFRIIAYDVSASRTESLRSKYLHLENVKFSNDERDLKDASHFLVCVPTMLGCNGKVDSSHVRSAIEMLHCYVSDKSIVVIESTVAVGMTREFLGPLAESHGIFAGMSPEVSKRSKQNGKGRADITTEDRSRSS